MVTLIITVDLQCCKCNAKIRKILTCLKERGEFTIEKIEYDEKNNKVIVTGPFDAEKLSSWLRCKAGKIIISIAVENPKPKPDPPKPEPPKPKPPPCTLVPFPYPYPLPYPTGPWKCPPEHCHCCSKPPTPPSTPPPPPPPPPQCSGCCDHHGHGDCGCSSCKRPCSCRPFVPLPAPVPWCDYKLVCEDNPSYACSIM